MSDTTDLIGMKQSLDWEKYGCEVSVNTPVIPICIICIYSSVGESD